MRARRTRQSSLTRETIRDDDGEIDHHAHTSDLDRDLVAPDTSTLSWDEEAHQEAWYEVDTLVERDSDAALYLQQIALYQQERGEESDDDEDDNEDDVEESDVDDNDAQLIALLRRQRVRGEPFDVMRFFDALAAEYNWTDAQIRATPWRSLLGYARESELRHEREARAYRNAQRGNGYRNGRDLDLDTDGDDYDDVEHTIEIDEARVGRLLARDVPIPYQRSRGA